MHDDDGRYRELKEWAASKGLKLTPSSHPRGAMYTLHPERHSGQVTGTGDPWGQSMTLDEVEAFLEGEHGNQAD